MYIPTLMSQHLDLTHFGIFTLSPVSLFKYRGMFLYLKTWIMRKYSVNLSKVNNFAMKFAEMSYGLYLIHIAVHIP